MKNLETKTENKFEGLYIIGYGLAGGFGGARTFEVIQVDSQEEADKWAWENACDEYDRYAGSNGLREVGEIMQEYEKKVMYNHYHNPYKEITGDCGN